MSAASDAAVRLRAWIKPEDAVMAAASWSRDGDMCRVRLGIFDGGELYRQGAKDVAIVLGLREFADDLLLGGDFDLDVLLDRLSVALFGEPGQIRGEYL